MPERLHKYLAHCGIASRRKAEEFILEGRVEVNGQIVTELGVQIEPGTDSIRFDGKPIREEKKVYYLLHKPRGVTTTSDDEHGRKTVIDLLGTDIPERVYPVGRLDRDSEGLLVLTNDGDLAWYLTHPSCGVRKTYHVVVEGIISDAMIAEILEKGVRLGPDLIKPLAMKLLRRYRNSTSLHITVAEGVNREIRRVFAMLGHEVMKLLRLEIGPLKIQKLPRGEYRPLTRRELSTLFHGMERVGAAMEDPEPKDRRRKKAPVKKRQRTGKPDPAAHGPSGRGARKPGTRGGKPTSSKRSTPSGDAHPSSTKPRGAAKAYGPSRNAAKPGHPIHAGRPSGSAAGRSAPTAPRSSSATPPRGSSDATGSRTAKGFKTSYAPKGTKAPYAAKGSKPSYANKDSKAPYAAKGSKPSYANKDSKAPYAAKGSKPSYANKDSKAPYAAKGSKPSYANKDAKAPYAAKGSKPSYANKDSKAPYAAKGSKPSKNDHRSKGGNKSHQPNTSRKPSTPRSAAPSHPLKGRKR